MATVKTVDDVNALEEAMHSSNEGYFWIGLKKKSTNTICSNGGCSNELEWADGSEFIFNGELDVNANIQGKCFVYQSHATAFDVPCTTDKNEFLCQYECPVSPDPCKTDTGYLCLFPFDYGGKTYNECTDDIMPDPWCATGPNVNIEWGYCDSNCFTSTTSTPAENCDDGVDLEGCGTGPIAIGPKDAITGVVSCQNHCKNVNGATHFTLRTNSPQLECRCKGCIGTYRTKTGFVSGKITCAGKIAVASLVPLY